LRKVTFAILAVALVMATSVERGFGAKYESVSITPIAGLAYQNLDDVGGIIDAWNTWMTDYLPAFAPGMGTPTAEEIGKGYSIIGDVRYRLGSRFLLALRAEYITDNASTLASGFGNEFSAAAVPISLTAVYEFPGVLPSYLRRAKLNLGVGAGVVMRGVYKFEMYTPVDNHLTARATARGFQLHTLAEVEYPVFDHWGVVAEVSYRYTRIGELTYRSVSGSNEQTHQQWEGDGTTPGSGIFTGIPYPVVGEKVVYTTSGDVMKLDFSGFNLRIGLRLYAW